MINAPNRISNIRQSAPMETGKKNREAEVEPSEDAVCHIGTRVDRCEREANHVEEAEVIRRRKLVRHANERNRASQK